MATNNSFKDKKITLMGLGLLGRGVGDAEYLARCGADLIVTDLKSGQELQSSLERLKGFSNITYTLGEHKLEDFRNRDMIIKAAGVPLNNPYVEEAQKHNIPVEMSTALFADLSGVRIIGVTGTRGKSTVTSMIFESLEKESGAKRLEGNVYLGGNVRGLSTLALLDVVTPEDIVVLELDSWQLQGFRTRKVSPHISVFTTFMPDHMNYYGGDLSLYFKDKAGIYEFQKETDILIVGKEVEAFMEKFNMPAPHKNVYIVGKENLASVPTLLIPGEHNRLNAALALVALSVCGVEKAEAERYVSEFKGVTGRLEKIVEKKGKIFYNDTTATTPEAATAALEALKGNGRTIIAGGSDKGLDFAPFIHALSSVEHIVMLPGAGTDRLVEEFPEPQRARMHFVQTMAEAVSVADSLTSEGGVILLSPGCASFGLFKNEFDRGDQFVRALKEL